MRVNDKLGQITVRMNSEHLETLRRQKIKTGRSVNSLLRSIIKQYCDKVEKG